MRCFVKLYYLCKVNVCVHKKNAKITINEY